MADSGARTLRQPEAQPGAQRAPGLVHISTSDTIELDQAAIRAKKLRQATITGARLLQEQLSQGGQRTYPVMVTLTYAALGMWDKRHVTAYLKNCREWFRRRGKAFHYCWVAELQTRGAVHYHVMIWMPKGFVLPKPDKCGWWAHGMTRIEKARNPVGYLAKYVSKEAMRVDFPKGIRLHGRGGLSIKSRIELRWWCSPVWVRRWTGDIVCDVRRTSGGGYIRLDNGEWRPSPYQVILIGGAKYLTDIAHSFQPRSRKS